MKNQKLVDELVNAGIYSVDYLSECSSSEDIMTTKVGENIYKKVDDNNLSDDEIKLLLSLKQTSYLKSIKLMITFFTALTVIGICLFLYLFFKVNSLF
jgi:hypothetical protein